MEAGNLITAIMAVIGIIGGAFGLFRKYQENRLREQAVDIEARAAIVQNAIDLRRENARLKDLVDELQARVAHLEELVPNGGNTEAVIDGVFVG